jgi:hypothetical protein
MPELCGADGHLLRMFQYRLAPLSQIAYGFKPDEALALPA